ncbi:MAG: cytochrome bd ubiquinol oxidase subunit [Gammaproteobacteria bacterium]|jgi:cytochrome d ubiquinol oxidase subunit II|nr:cytochrome bd ubiquinol oxidase subunit [Gammaproteobacteria bacterium]
MHIDLTVIWAGIILFAVAMYVVMDGFDLGIGILFTRFQVGAERDTAMNSIAPVWDGNETWLVLGGGGLMAAFPLAYAIILPALYAPIIAMLLSLVFRGVAFEFRWRDPEHRARWDAAFCLGSIGATFAQGITLGALLQGIKISGRAYAGGYWDWLTPFSILTGLSLIIGYALLGACWLIWKTQGGLNTHARRYARVLSLGMLAAIALVSLYTPFLDAQYYRTWFTGLGRYALALMPVVVAGIGIVLYRRIATGHDSRPFLLTLSLFGLSLLGLGISMWPDLIPGRLSIWDAAAPPSSQSFMLVGACILLPLILAYTAWAYWVFRGKVAHEGYH